MYLNSNNNIECRLSKTVLSFSKSNNSFYHSKNLFFLVWHTHIRKFFEVTWGKKNWEILRHTHASAHSYIHTRSFTFWNSSTIYCKDHCPWYSRYKRMGEHTSICEHMLYVGTRGYKIEKDVQHNVNWEYTLETWSITLLQSRCSWGYCIQEYGSMTKRTTDLRKGMI